MSGLIANAGCCAATIKIKDNFQVMCRFVFYRGAPIRLSSLVTEPAHSIIHQSYHSNERAEPLNGDGFGISWYAPKISNRPVIFKDISPAWNNQNLTNLAPVIRSPCIVAHVRAATPGLPVSQLNCHPFSWGRFSFAHNGEIGGFRKIRRKIQSRLSEEAFDMLKGSTDSEHLFALFASKYDRMSKKSKLEAMASALSEAIATVESVKRQSGVIAVSTLNLVLTDGDLAVITRYVSPGEEEPHSLYLHIGAAYECVNGVCRMRNGSDLGNTVLVASEPLSRDSGWSRVSANSMLLVNKELSVEERPFTLQ